MLDGAAVRAQAMGEVKMVVAAMAVVKTGVAVVVAMAAVAVVADSACPRQHN